MISDMLDRIKADGYEKVLAVTISSGLSGTFNMVRLAAELGDSRLDVSRMLNQLQSEGLLQLHRGRIDIVSLERLL